MNNFLLLNALLLLGAAARADVRIVAPSGTPYNQIQTAVDASLDGDTILVKSGTYASFVVSARSLTIAGDTGHTVDIDGSVRVRNLGGDQQVVLANLSASGVYTPNGTGQYGLYAINNAGALRVQTCSFRGAAGNANHHNGYTAIWLENCQDAAFSECGALGGSGTDGWDPSTGISGDGLRASGSTLALHDSLIRGGDGMDGTDCNWSPDGGWGGQGLRAIGSVVLVAGGSVRGGDGGDGSYPSAGCNCGPGAVGGPGGHALNASSASVVYVQGDTEPLAYDGRRVAGFCGVFRGDAVPARTGQTFLDLPGPARTLGAVAVARENQGVSLSVHGLAGEHAYLLMNTRPADASFVASWQGMLLVQPTVPLRLLILGDIPASGTLACGLPPQDLGAGVLERSLHVQLLVVDASGQYHLGEARTLVLLDQSF